MVRATDLDQTHSEVLAFALRSRVGTRAELIELGPWSTDEVDTALRDLQRAGFLTETAGVITYRRPDVAAAELAQGVIDGLGASLADTIDRTRRTLGSLPGLLQAWEMGNSESNSLHIDVLHGPWAPADMWQLQYSRGIPLTSDVCMPDTSIMAAVKPEHQASFWQSRAGEPLRVRLIMSVADATSEALQDRIRSEMDAGVSIRMHPNPPSWFWVTDLDTVGLPLTWGQAWPSSVMAIKSEALAAQLAWVFERVWQESVPLGVPEHPWDSLLELMNRGLTMEAASHALGLAARTGRRRAAEAMKHYGVSSLFALGAAWSNDSAAREG